MRWPRLVDNWRAWPRMASMWCLMAIAGLCCAWLAIGWINGVPYLVGPVGIAWVLGLAVLGGILRLVAQPGLVESVAAALDE